MFLNCRLLQNSSSCSATTHQCSWSISRNSNLKSIAIKAEVKIPTLLLSILGQNTTSARPTQIYMNVGVSLLRFKYPATLQKLYYECKIYTTFSQTMFPSKIYPFPLKVKNFIVFVTLLNFFVVKLFTLSVFYFTPLFNVFLASFTKWRIFIFQGVAFFWWFFYFFSFWRRKLYNTWKSLYRQLQGSIMIFNKNALAYISSIFNSKNPIWKLLSFVSRIVVNKCLENSVQNCFNFALITTYWWNCKNTCFSQ